MVSKKYMNDFLHTQRHSAAVFSGFLYEWKQVVQSLNDGGYFPE